MSTVVPAVENALQGEMRTIVESLYGPMVRNLPGLNIGRAYRGARGESRYGGDVIDVFHYGAGKTSVAVVDITGHGMAAARNAGLAKHALRGFASIGFDARDCVRALNRLCIDNSAFEGDEEFFATLFFAIITDLRTMQYVSAGHDAAYLIEPGVSHVLAANGPLIGLLDDDNAFEQCELRMLPGSIVAAVTDGFSESRDAAGTFLGRDALIDIIVHNRYSEAEEIAEAVTLHAYEFTNESLHDDVAALVVKVTE